MCSSNLDFVSFWIFGNLRFGIQSGAVLFQLEQVFCHGCLNLFLHWQLLRRVELNGWKYIHTLL